MLATALQVTVSDSNFVSNFGRQTGVIQMMGNSSQLSVSNSLFYNNTGANPGNPMRPEGSATAECSKVAMRPGRQSGPDDLPPAGPVHSKDLLTLQVPRVGLSPC